MGTLTMQISMAASSGTINLPLGQGTEPAYKQYNVKENRNLKSELAQKLNNETLWHMNTHLHPNVRPNQRFQSWPPEIVSIVYGPYWCKVNHIGPWGWVQLNIWDKASCKSSFQVSEVETFKYYRLL